MTTTQPRRSVTRRLTAPFRAFGHLNWDPTGLGEAIVPSGRVPQPRPTPHVPSQALAARSAQAAD